MILPGSPGALTSIIGMDSSSILDSLAAYPRWFVAACLTVALATLIWVAAILFKWAIRGLIAAVLVGGVVVVIWLLVK